MQSQSLDRAHVRVIRNALNPRTVPFPIEVVRNRPVNSLRREDILAFRLTLSEKKDSKGNTVRFLFL